MSFFPVDPTDGDEIGPNTNGSFFRYVAVDNKWILIPNADVYTEAEVDAFKLNKWVAPDGSIAMNNQKFTGLTAGTTNGDSVRFEQLHAEGHVLATSGPHTGTLPWTDLSKTGSSLADLATRAHSNLSDAPTSAHHVRYANSEVDARIVVQNTDPTGTIDMAIDALINTHNVADNHIAHTGVTITAGTGLSGGGNIAAGFTINCDITQYTDALAVAAIEAVGLDFDTTKTLGFVDDVAGVFIDRIYDENNMTSDDEHGLATQQSIKAHVAAEIAGAGAFNPPIGFITMYSGAWTDNTTIPGWYKCDGNNGTVNLVDKFVRGGATSGATGGSDDAVVVEHTHTENSRGEHDHSEGNRSNVDGTYSDVVRSGGAIYAQTTAMFSDDGGHTHTINNTGVSGTGANKPAYYTLIFIQRIS